MNILLIIVAIILPPLAVFLETGFSLQLFINIILSLLGYVPGIIHALWVVFVYS